MKARTALAAALCAATVAALAAAPTPASDNDAAGAAEQARKRVYVYDNYFEPRSIGVRRGGRVTFIWRGEDAHNVTFTKVPRGASKRGASTRDHGRFTRSFHRRGLYKFECTLHAGMRGTIDVNYIQLLR